MDVITVEIYDEEDDGHTTYIKNNNNEYMRFGTDGYCGTDAKEIIDFLKFIGYDVFVVYHNRKDYCSEHFRKIQDSCIN